MKLRTMIGLAVLGAAPLTMPVAAMAQEKQPAAPPAAQQEPKDNEVEEVVVTGRFIASGASSATKLDIPVRDTPFSVAAYSDAFIAAIETTKVDELYRYMTGVQRAGNTGYDLTLRGFKTSGNDRNAIMTDGLPGLAIRFGSPPTVGTDHIELVKGPASILYGQAQPGGFINIITKKPRPHQSTEVEVRGSRNIGSPGRGSGIDFSIDSTGPLGSSDKLLYRVIADTAYTTGFRDFSYERPLYVAPSLTWNVTDDLAVTLQYEYRKTKTHYDTYLVAPHKDVAFIAPINTTYQEPGDYLKESGKTLSLFVTDRINEHVHFNFSFRDVNHKDTQANFDVVAVLANFTQVSRRARQQVNHRNYDFGDANFVLDFDLGPIQNKAVVGVQAGRELADLNRVQFFNGTTTPGPQNLNISVLDPVHGLTQPLSFYPLVNASSPANLNDRFSTSDSWGVYVSDLLTFTENFKAMVGLRYAFERQSIYDKKIATVPYQAVNMHDVLPMAGLIYQPSKQWSFYVSYSTSFVPVPPSNFDINGLYSFQPTTAASVEFGVKANLFDDKVSLTAARYDIKKKNVINTFTCALGTCAEQVGGEEAKGFELEVNAQILPEWQITAGYAFTDGKVTDSDIAAQVGARLTNSAKNAAHIWSRYDFKDGPLKDFGVGVGVAYNGDRTGLLPTATSSALLILPAYTVVDLGFYYAMGETDFTLKVSNLFDEKYYDSAGFTADIQIVPGAPRTATFSVRTRF